MPFVIVDDTDPAIWANPLGLAGDYVRGFSTDKFTTSFYGTVSGTAKSVTTLGYPFNGMCYMSYAILLAEAGVTFTFGRELHFSVWQYSKPP